MLFRLPASSAVRNMSHVVSTHTHPHPPPFQSSVLRPQRRFTIFDILAEVRGNDCGTSVGFGGVATGCRGNSRVSTASATAHGTSTVNATACAAVLSVANSVVPTIATHESRRQLPLQFPVAISTAIRGRPRSLRQQSSYSDAHCLIFPTILHQ